MLINRKLEGISTSAAPSDNICGPPVLTPGKEKGVFGCEWWRCGITPIKKKKIPMSIKIKINKITRVGRKSLGKCPDHPNGSTVTKLSDHFATVPLEELIKLKSVATIPDSLISNAQMI